MLAERLHTNIAHDCITFSVGELSSQLLSCRTELLRSVFVDMWVFKSLPSLNPRLKIGLPVKQSLLKGL